MSKAKNIVGYDMTSFDLMNDFVTAAVYRSLNNTYHCIDFDYTLTQEEFDAYIKEGRIIDLNTAMRMQKEYNKNA